MADLDDVTGKSAIDAPFGGLLINVGEAKLKDGLHGVVNQLSPSASPRLRVNQKIHVDLL